MRYLQKAVTIFGMATLSLLPPQSLAAERMMTAEALSIALADGKPWKFSAPEGLNGTIIFQRNGKVTLTQGKRTVKAKWHVKGQEICLAMGIMLGTKCLTGVAEGRGYQTYEKNKRAFLFTR
jgi:hypothetical protein